MDKTVKPGYYTKDELWSTNPARLRRFVDKKILPFLHVAKYARCLDVGEANPRMEYIKERTGLNVKQFDTGDLNFVKMPEIKAYDAIFAFDIVEHLQNPLWFMKQMKDGLAPDGSIYVCYPTNPQWMWHELHFFEMKPKHFEKWIIKPLGLEIVRKKRIIFIPNWKAIFIGVRPILRIARGELKIRDWVRSLLYVKHMIFEIKVYKPEVRYVDARTL